MLTCSLVSVIATQPKDSFGDLLGSMGMAQPGATQFPQAGAPAPEPELEEPAVLGTVER
jgi:hypothetical protein